LQSANPRVTFNLLRYSYGANLLLQGESLETVRRQMRFARLEDFVSLYGGFFESKNFLSNNVKDYYDIYLNGEGKA
jgi:hypothetical protein